MMSASQKLTLSTPPTKFSATGIRLKRTARRLFWPHPCFYYPFGIMRKRGNVFQKGMDIYMGGYPRSGNTFSRSAFLAANPRARVHTHQHIPSCVLSLVKREVPGIVLIRTPLDAAVSWAIHQNQTLEEAVAYWNDYYETLLPARSGIFLVQFKDVITDFGAVITAFNAHFGTSYAPFVHTAESAARCFQVTEEDWRKPDGGIREMQVCRPSPVRDVIKERHLEQLDRSDFLQEELARANDLYEKFVNFPTRAEKAAPREQDAFEPAMAVGASAIVPGV